MDSIKEKINNKVSVKTFHTDTGTKRYLVDNSTGDELCEVDLVEGVDLSCLLCKLKNDRSKKASEKRL